MTRAIWTMRAIRSVRSIRTEQRIMYRRILLAGAYASAALNVPTILPSPVATGTPDPVAAETANLVTVTFYLVVVTVAAVLVPVVIELVRGVSRRIEHADHADAARRQLVVFLQAYENVAAKLAATPRESVAPQTEALRPLFERALALDIASAISPARRSEVYIALALAQQTIVEANVRQQALKRELEALEQERKDVEDVLRAGRAYSQAIRDLELQIGDSQSRAQKTTMETSLRSLKASQTAHNASLAYSKATEFEQTEPQRRRRIDSDWAKIGTDADIAHIKLRAALAALAGTTSTAPAGDPPPAR